MAELADLPKQYPANREMLTGLAALAKYLTPEYLKEPPVRDMPTEPGKIPPNQIDWGMAQSFGLGDLALMFMGGGAKAAVPAIGGLARLAPKGIRAFHGSPYDFNKFNLSKIGTGEGAQAYGHGLYFAEKEGTARTYRDSLGGSPKVFIGDKEIGRVDDPALVSSGLLTPSQQRALAFSMNWPSKDSAIEGMRKRGGEWAVMAKELETTRGDLRSGGKMYEVNINAHPDQFLDWNRPFAEQATQVQEGVRRVLGSEPVPQSSDAARGYDVYEQVINRGLDTRPSIYRDDRLLWQEAAKKRPIASSMLNEAGIPGIKYLDQGSRSTGEGSRNYVVFNDQIIDILRKFGITVPAAGVGANAMENR